MSARHPLAVALLAVCTAVLAPAAPATALAVTAAVAPVCQINDPEIITGATVSNNQVINGTWHYATGVVCNSNLADMELYQELDFNGIKVDSNFRGFSGMPRYIDAIFSTFPCAVCNGDWKFVWAQIITAPAGFLFTNPPAGCVLYGNGLYQACVQTKTVHL